MIKSYEIMTFTDPFFWISFLYFFFAVIIAFFVPGDLFIKKLQRPLFQRIILSTIIGMILWALQGYLFGYLQMRWGTYLYLFITTILWILGNKTTQFSLTRFSILKFRHIDFLLVAIFVLGISVQFLSVGFNGITYNGGLHFGVPDSIYHIAMVHALVQNFPPYEPGMSGELVKNYHYLSNLIVAELVRVFKLPFLYMQNQYITILLALLMGSSALVFTQILKLQKVYSYWLLFFLYFYGDFIFFISWLLGKGLNFTYKFQENAATLWISPPRVFAIAIIFAGLTLLVLWIKKKQYSVGLLMALLFGSLIGFKVYVGIFALSGLGFLGLYYLLKRELRMLVPILVAFLLSICLYLPTNSGAGGLTFSGFWRLENFIINPAYDLKNWELARKIYLEHNNYLRVAQYEIMYLLLFIPSFFGIFLLGFFQTKKSFALLPKQAHIFLLSGALTSMILGLFFLQQIGGANTVQFFFCIYFVGAIYTAFTCAMIMSIKNIIVKSIIVLVIIFFTIPRIIDMARIEIDLVVKPPVTVSSEELQALAYLKRNTPQSAVVLVGDKRKVLSNDSYYISFLSDRAIFLVGNGILTDHGVSTQKRLQAIETVLLEKDAAKIGEILLANNIDYLYLSSQHPLASKQSDSFLKPVLKNDTITVLAVEEQKATRYFQTIKQ